MPIRTILAAALAAACLKLVPAVAADTIAVDITLLQFKPKEPASPESRRSPSIPDFRQGRESRSYVW